MTTTNGAATATRKTKASPEPDGPRWAYCKHCEEQIKQERRGVPWYHIDDETVAC